MPEEKIVSLSSTKSSLLKKTLTYLGIVIGLVLLAIGMWQQFERYVSTHGVALLPNPNQTVTTDNEQPDEAKPSQVNYNEYAVPADQPRKIQIISVGINGLIQRIGLTKNNAMAAPANIFYAGWFTNNVKPGQPGLSIINGHVSGKYQDGIFKKLIKLKAKDVVEVEFGNKSIKRFSVVEINTLPEANSAEFLFKKSPQISSQLNLITCGGKFNKKTQTYEDRIIVVAKLVEP